MDGQFKLGDQVRIVSQDGSRVSISERTTIDKAHKSNGNLIVQGKQFHAHNGYQASASNWRTATRLVRVGSAECERMIARHRRQTHLNRLRQCDWSLLPDDALERLCGLLEAEQQQILKRDSRSPS